MKFASLLALSLAAFNAPAHGYDLEESHQIFCATRTQVERVAALLDGSALAAVKKVNTEANDAHACFSATVSYVRGARSGVSRKRAATFEIVEILVVGAKSKDGQYSELEPAVYFSLFEIDERAA